jgi:hypothetical protein
MKKAAFIYKVLQDFKMIRGLIILNLLLGSFLLGNYVTEGWLDAEGDPDQLSMVGCFSGGAPIFMDQAIGPVKVSDDKKSITFMSKNRKVEISILNATCMVIPEKAEG